jgi:outer membrane protein TolC
MAQAHLERQLQSAEEGLGVARAGYYPTLSLDANRYTHREGISERVDWDILLSGEFSLFEGGATGAKTRQAQSTIRAAELELERARRQVVLELHQAHSDFASLQSQLESLEKGVASAQENYEIVQAEYRQNITTNLEVLTSLNTLQDARLERDRALYQLKLADIKLAVSRGEIR